MKLHKTKPYKTSNAEKEDLILLYIYDALVKTENPWPNFTLVLMIRVIFRNFPPESLRRASQKLCTV